MSAVAYAHPQRKPMRGPQDQQWDRVGRLVQVLWLLTQAGPGGLRLDELAEALPVSKRTVSRDLASLENAGIPVIRTGERDRRMLRWRRYAVDLDPRQRAAATQMALLVGRAR